MAAARMRAIVTDGFGGPEVLRLGEAPRPRPSQGQVLIKVAATSVNRADLQQRAGNYPPPPGESEILGLEVAGRIEEVGAGVTGWRTGDRVMTLVGGGGYATISDAIAAANNGDTILVAPGTYNESLLINKEVNIVGLGNPGDVVIQGTFRTDQAGGPVVGSIAEWLKTRTQGQGGYVGDTGVTVNADNVSLTNLTVTEFKYAIGTQTQAQKNANFVNSVSNLTLTDDPGSLLSTGDKPVVFGGQLFNPNPDLAVQPLEDAGIWIQFGGVNAFGKNKAGGFDGLPGDFATLTETSGAFQLREQSGEIIRFRTDGRWDLLQDRNGNRITAAYTGGQLASITHSNGSMLTLTYNAQGRVSQVTDPAGRMATYTYDASGEHLLSVTTVAGETSTVIASCSLKLTRCCTPAALALASDSLMRCGSMSTPTPLAPNCFAAVTTMRPSPGNGIGSPLRCEGSCPVRLQPITNSSFSIARARSSVRQAVRRGAGQFATITNRS